METRVRYVVVGVFVVLLGTTALVAFLWLSRGIEQPVYTRYYAYFRESVSGLNRNAPVKYRGVEVGKVAEIVLNPANVEEVRLTLDIARGTPVKTDTVATLRVQGLTGLSFVDLSGGSQGAPLLAAKPGERYPVIATGPSLLTRLDADITGLISGVNGFTEDARAVMDKENRAALRRILADLARLTDTMAKRSAVVDRGIVRGAQALENIARITETLDARIPAILDNVNGGAAAISDTAGEVGEAGRRVAGAGRELEAMVRENRGNVERFTGRGLPEFTALVEEMRRLTRQLERVARQLEQEPDSVIRGRHPEPPGPGE
ncbi:MAG: MlaD family protein [Gemmatimonadota bacterium]